MNITTDIKYVGVNHRDIKLFEAQYAVPHGMCYNSYVITDEKIAVMDSVEASFGDEWLANINEALEGAAPHYLVVQHMEPDHSANIARFAAKYPEAIIVSSAKAFVMMKNFFGTDYAERRIVVGEGDTLSLGKHTLTFYTAPMVHWPEVIVSYDSFDKVLFSADGFGKFGTYDADEPWCDEARRYYIGIVGKYGAQVQALLKKAAALDISIICPLHGPVLSENLSYYIGLYDTWSSYRPEAEGVAIVCSSIYGNTKRAADELSEMLKKQGIAAPVYDITTCDMAEAVAAAFKYDRLVLASSTYNAEIFPPMREFIAKLLERGFNSRLVALIENGSWAPMAAKVMRGKLEGAKNITFAQTAVKINSALNDESRAALKALASEFAAK